MSKLSSRPNREAIKKQRKETKKAEKHLLKIQRAKGFKSVQPSISNGKNKYKTVAEEQQIRMTAVTEQHRILQANLPVLLKRLSKIPDPRNPKKIKYKLTALMIYGILIFVFQMSSKREANRKMTLPMFIENLKQLFSEFEELPHNDTLMRLLERINISEIEKAQLDMVNSLIRKKKFIQYLINGRYPVAIDGTQKFVRSCLWSEECLEREVKKGDSRESNITSPKPPGTPGYPASLWKRQISTNAVIWVRAFAGILNLNYWQKNARAISMSIAFHMIGMPMKGYHYLMRIGRTINVLRPPYSF